MSIVSESESKYWIEEHIKLSSTVRKFFKRLTSSTEGHYHSDCFHLWNKRRKGYYCAQDKQSLYK
jgi:hypothetical protein